MAKKKYPDNPHIASQEEIEAEWNRDRDYIQGMEYAKKIKTTNPGLIPDETKQVLVTISSSNEVLVHSELYNKLELIGILTKAIQKLSNEQEQ